MYPYLGWIFFQIFFSDPKVLPYSQKEVKSCLLRKKVSGAEKIAKIEWKLTEDRSSPIFHMNEKSAFFWSKIDFFTNLTLSAFQNALKVPKLCLLTSIWGSTCKIQTKKYVFGALYKQI